MTGFVWIDPWSTLATHREALKMEREAYARCDAERRGLAEVVRAAGLKVPAEAASR